MAAMTLPELRLQSVVRARVGATGAFLPAIRTSSVALVGAMGGVVGGRGGKGEPRGEIS